MGSVTQEMASEAITTRLIAIWSNRILVTRGRKEEMVRVLKISSLRRLFPQKGIIAPRKRSTSSSSTFPDKSPARGHENPSGFPEELPGLGYQRARRAPAQLSRISPPQRGLDNLSGFPEELFGLRLIRELEELQPHFPE